MSSWPEEVIRGAAPQAATLTAIEASVTAGVYVPSNAAYDLIIHDGTELHYLFRGTRCKRPDESNWTGINLGSGASVGVSGGIQRLIVPDRGTTFQREGFQHALASGEQHVVGILCDPSMNGTGTATDSWQVGVWDSVNGDGIRASRSTANGGYLTVTRHATFDGGATSTPYAEETGDHFFVDALVFVQVERLPTVAIRVGPTPQGPWKDLLTGESDSDYDTLVVTWANRSGLDQHHYLFHHAVTTP